MLSRNYVRLVKLCLTPLRLANIRECKCHLQIYTRTACLIPDRIKNPTLSLMYNLYPRHDILIYKRWRETTNNQRLEHSMLLAAHKLDPLPDSSQPLAPENCGSDKNQAV